MKDCANNQHVKPYVKGEYCQCGKSRCSPNHAYLICVPRTPVPMPDKYIEEAVKIVEAVPEIGGLEPDRVTLFDVHLEGYGNDVAGLVLSEAIASALRSHDEQHRREVASMKDALVLIEGLIKPYLLGYKYRPVERLPFERILAQLGSKEEKGV